MVIVTLSSEKFETHRKIATQVNALYVEINKLATKKPTERITTLVSRKINHVISKVKEHISDDDFLDAIEIIPVEGNFIRLDEALIILGELKGTLDRKWASPEYKAYREHHHVSHFSQIMH